MTKCLMMMSFNLFLNCEMLFLLHFYRELYGVTEQDRIYVSSPPTFDPFMVDICLALNYGASLVMVDHKLRFNAKRLLNILFPTGQQSNVTIMQITPSLFMRWALDDIKRRVFSTTSLLRIMAFGGEPFPVTNSLRKWTNWEDDPMIRIFNLYGLTEMSCWAAVYEITKNDILENRKIPIGQPIDRHTAFQVNDDGELLLKSFVRKCVQPQFTDAQIIDSQFELILHTGDLVYIENGAFYFTSRTNSVIKFYGQKINLGDIEQYAQNVDNVEDVVCIHDENHNSIVLFVRTQDDVNFIKEQIEKALRSVSVHVKIYCVSEFPLTTHGKVCKYDLLNSTIVNKTGKELQSIQSKFLQLINESLGTVIQASGTWESQLSEKKTKMECDLSFIQLGGTSLKAIQIVNELETMTSQSNAHLLTMLLDEQMSIRKILSDFNERNAVIQSQSLDSIQIIPEIRPRWKINMEKCIDATPTVCILRDGEVVISVGSHSKLLYNISILNGEILSKLMLPDRIESQVIQMDDFGIVGCYDGHLYCFDIRTGILKWQFDSGGMIKCRALLINSSVLFGNYNELHNFWHLNAIDGSLKWSLKIGTKSIYANPVKLNDENCLVCSLDGMVARLNCLTAQIVWSFDSKAPIFSTPTVLQNSLHETQIVLAAVNGTIFCLTIDGDSIWSYQIDGNLFSSIEYFPSSVDKNCTNLIFGSQNRYLYCLKIGKESSCAEVWHILSSASIRSSVVFIQREPNLLAAIFSSDGVVKVINCDNGKLIRQRRINGDVFSTPILHNGRLFVGSRNNFLYCIDLDDLTGSSPFLDRS